MDNLKQLYNQKLARVRKYTELPIHEQEKYNNEFTDLICGLDNLILDMGVDAIEWQHEILSGFEV